MKSTKLSNKQKQVLDYLIREAKRQILLGECSTNDILSDGLWGLANFGEIFMTAICKYYSSPCYQNDAATGGNCGGYSEKVLIAIEEPFIDYFKSI